MVHLLGLLAACVSAGFSAPGPQAPVHLPFHDAFSRGWDAGWTVHVSAGDRLEIAGGALRISARANTYAHLSRPLGIDDVRIAAQIKPGDARSWCTSLFLYWGPGNWCQAGIVPGPNHYSVEVVDGKPEETDLAGAASPEWQHLAIELGGNIVRWYGSADGAKWTLLRSIRRPRQWRGAPARLIVGKGYGLGTGLYSKPDLDNDYADPGEEVASLVRDLSITRTPAGLVGVSAEDRRLWSGVVRDKVGDAVLAMKGDPTFDRVKALFPKLKFPREAVGVKDHPDEFVIEPDGAVLFGKSNTDPAAPRAYWEIGEPARIMGGPKMAIIKKAPGWMPISMCLASDRGLRLRAYAFAWSKGMSPDNPTTAFLKLIVTNPTKTTRRVPVTLRVLPEGLGVKPLAWELEIAPGQSVAARAKAPYAVVAEGLEKADADEESSMVSDIVEAWTKTFSAGKEPTVPDPLIGMMWHRSLAYSFINVDKVNGIYEPHDGSGFYEEVYGYSAAHYCQALDLWGFHADSERYLNSLLTMVKPDGLFEVNFGYADMGVLLKTLSMHYFLTGDATWFKSVAPTMSRIVGWILRHRRISMRLVDGRRPVTYGLIKYRPYCDYASPTYSYLGESLGVVGIEWAARAFAQVGLTAESRRFAQAGAAYRRDVLASMKAAVFRREGVTMLPMEPDTHRLLKDNNYSGGDYYGLVAPLVLESGFLPAGSLYAALIVKQMENRNGLILRMCQFHGGIDHAYTYGYWLNLLQRDQVRPVLVGLYGTLAYGMSRETFAPVECTAIRTGLNDVTTPHTYSDTQQLRLLRALLVREDGDTLWLAQATPRAWLENGKVVSLKGAPTLFGPVSFTIRSEAAHRRISATVDLPHGSDLKAVKLRIRCPEGFRPASATVDGRRAAIRNEIVVLRPTRRTVKVVVTLIKS